MYWKYWRHLNIHGEVSVKSVHKISIVEIFSNNIWNSSNVFNACSRCTLNTNTLVLTCICPTSIAGINRESSISLGK